MGAAAGGSARGGRGAVHMGQKRCIRVEGNAMPFGVGKMVVSDADITAKGMKGKGMAAGAKWRLPCHRTAAHGVAWMP